MIVVTLSMDHAPPERTQEPARGRLTDHGDVETLPALRPGYCDYCGTQLSKAKRARRSRFCSAECRKNWWDMAKVRGARIYQLMMIWRSTFGKAGTRGAGMISRVSAILDDWRRADAARRDETGQ